MLNKAAGSPIDVWHEHLRTNPGQFSTTFASDTWEQQSGNWRLSPARIQAGQSQAQDATAYATTPVQASWWDRRWGYSTSPAQIASGIAARSASFESGSLT